MARPVEARQVGTLDRDLRAALHKLGFDITDDKIAEIKGDMTIRLLRSFDSLLEFVVELPDGKEMIFDLDEHTQVEIIEATKRWQ
jgi:chemotaxis regulatin CheY-phosphate phosphatase CheZ